MLLALLVAPFARAVAEDEPVGTPERITQGSEPWLSPDGRYLAFKRMAFDLDQRDARGQPDRRPVLHVRDMTTAEEWKAQADLDVTGWAAGDLVIDRDGSSLRVSDGSAGPAFPGGPEAHTPSWARSPDGRTIAFTTYAGTRERSPIQVVGPGATRRSLELGASLFWEEAAGLLAFSPDGRRLLFRLGFLDEAQRAHPRIGLFDLAADACTWLADETWGARQSERYGPHLERGPSAWAAWDAAGTRLVFVKAYGVARRDLHTARADGTELQRLTTDGAWKAAPCLDPAGDRCAFWVRDERDATAPDLEAKRGPRSLFSDERVPLRLRVLMLRTGELVDIATPPRGFGHALQWSADGRDLWFGWAPTNGVPGVWRVRAPDAPTVEPGTPVVDRTRSPRADALEALASGDHRETEAALRTLWEDRDPEVTAAVIATARRYVREGRRVPWGTFELLAERRAVAATPLLFEALSEGYLVGPATEMLLDWEVRDALPAWRRIARTADAGAKGAALVALARYGDDEDWARVEAHMRSDDADARWAVAKTLAHVRSPRSVDLLIRLLDDHGFLHTGVDGDTRVSHIAEVSLRALTGQRLGSVAARWRDWWERRGRTLPNLDGRRK